MQKESLEFRLLKLTWRAVLINLGAFPIGFFLTLLVSSLFTGYSGATALVGFAIGSLFYVPFSLLTTSSYACLTTVGLTILNRRQNTAKIPTIALSLIFLLPLALIILGLGSVHYFNPAAVALTLWPYAVVLSAMLVRFFRREVRTKTLVQQRNLQLS